MFTFAGAASTKNKNEKKAHIRAGLGPCAAEIRIIESSTDQVVGAEVTVSVPQGKNKAVKKLSLNSEESGIVLFEGLPAKAKDGLNFEVTFAGRTASLYVDPSKGCREKYQVVMPDRPPMPKR